MENRKKLMAIVNPFSGSSKKERVPQLIEEVIDHSRFDVEVALVTRELRVSDLAAQAVKKGYYGVIAVGGDGTVNGAASALRDSDVALAIIPCGSGNGLARHLEIPMNMRHALEVINRDHIEVCDYCTLNDDTFVCTAGMGFDAEIADRYAQRTKRGALNYVKTAFQVYARYKPIHCTIDIDGRVIDEDVFVITCANASQYGNNAFIAPQASLQDGLLDVTIIKPFSPLESPIVGGSLFTKTVTKNRHVDTYKARQVKIHSSMPRVYHVDGEPMSMISDMTVTCHPGGIKFFV
ncbi:MAG: diacylglycerol kinase family lipid kinase [Muribaculaceae bacterium]|nr:diacylglycerol kinase family lipid kinase [Muribaculaceae bacterium]